MISVLATIGVKSGKEAEFEAAFLELVKEVRKSEDGCKLYQLCKGEDPSQYTVLEIYVDQAAVDLHMKTPYFQLAFAKLGPLLGGPPSVKLLTCIG